MIRYEDLNMSFLLTEDLLAPIQQDGSAHLDMAPIRHHMFQILHLQDIIFLQEYIGLPAEMNYTL